MSAERIAKLGDVEHALAGVRTFAVNSVELSDRVRVRLS